MSGATPTNTSESRGLFLDFLARSQSNHSSLAETLDMLSPRGGGTWDDSCGQQIEQDYITPLLALAYAADSMMKKQSAASDDAEGAADNSRALMRDSQSGMADSRGVMGNAQAQNSAALHFCQQAQHAATNTRHHTRQCAELIARAAKTGASR